MWLSEKLTERQREEAASAEQGTVTLDRTDVAVFGRGERRHVTVIAPGGCAWRPRGGTAVLLLKGGAPEGGAYVLGAAEEPEEDLAPGELRLHSEGGARLTLRNDGRIELEGAVYINGEPYEAPEGAEDGA